MVMLNIVDLTGPRIAIETSFLSTTVRKFLDWDH